jgi:type I restriction enzyme M protein
LPKIANGLTITKCGLKESSAKILPENSIVVSTRATIGRIGVNLIPLATNQGFKNIIIIDLQRVVPKYVALAITTLVPLMNTLATGGTFKELSKTNFSELTIPFPPLPIQKDIVEKIEVEQAIVEKNRELIERFENKIEVSINSLWGE